MTYGAGPMLPWTEKNFEYWQSEITRAERLRNDKMVEWDVEGNISRYEVSRKALKAGEVNDGSDFADVERKKAGLFYASPFISVTPDPEGHPTVALLHQELLNALLDEPLVNAKAVALKALQTCLVAIQPAWTKIGYLPTVQSVPQMDPMTQQPMIGPDGQPMMASVVVHEEVFWSPISAKSGLLPIDARDTDFDRSAPWLGYKFRMPVSRVRSTYQVPPEIEIPAASGEQKLFFTDEDTPPVESSDDPLCTGTYIEYKAALVDPTVSHPGVIRCLVLIDGMKTPIKHADAPWLVDAQGQFNPRSGFTGFSIHPLVLRDLPDSAWVPSDSTITGMLTGEITDFLADVKRQRESNRLAVLYDSAKLTTEAVEKIESGKAPGFIPVKTGMLDAGKDSVMQQVAQIGSGREHYLGLDIFQSKREKILGISANTVGAEDDGEKTATEISAVTRNTEARFEQERQRVVAWYLSGVRKLAALVVRYGDTLAVDVLGPQRGQQWIQAKQQGLLGRFAYTVQIDGGKYMDVQTERKFWMDLYNLTGKDPNARRTEILKKIAAVAGLDSAMWVVEQLPEPKPEPPKVTFSVAATDLNPTLPHYPGTVEVLRQLGVTITQPTVMLSQQQAQALGVAGRSPVTGEQEQTETPDPENPLSMIKELSGPSMVPTAGVGPDPKQMQQAQHGGSAETMEQINRHQSAKSGQRSGPRVN